MILTGLIALNRTEILLNSLNVNDIELLLLKRLNQKLEHFFLLYLQISLPKIVLCKEVFRSVTQKKVLILIRIFETSLQ